MFLKNKIFIVSLTFYLFIMISLYNSAVGENLPEVVERLKNSTVSIEVNLPDGKSGIGTGFAVQNSKGVYVITSLHIVKDASTITISTTTGKKFETKIVEVKPEADLALLEIPSETVLPPVTVGNSKLLKGGETVIALGNPLGIKNYVSKGIVSSPEQDFEGIHIILLDIRVNPGNSGGPLFLEDGRVVGIVEAKTKVMENIDSVGLAIASTDFEKWLGIEGTSPGKAVSGESFSETFSTDYIVLLVIIALNSVVVVILILFIIHRMKSPVGWLVIEEPAGARRSMKIFEGVTTIGRSIASAVNIKDREISASHLKLECGKEGIKIRDLGSRNGTKVNGKKITETFLNNGDSIEIGKSVLTILQQK